MRLGIRTPENDDSNKKNTRIQTPRSETHSNDTLSPLPPASEILSEIEQTISPLTTERKRLLRKDVEDYIASEGPIRHAKRFLPEVIQQTYSEILPRHILPTYETTPFENHLFEHLTKTVNSSHPKNSDLLVCAELLDTYFVNKAVFEQHLSMDPGETLSVSAVGNAEIAKLMRDAQTELKKSFVQNELTGGIKRLSPKEFVPERVTSLTHALKDPSLTPYPKEKSLTLLHDYITRSLKQVLQNTSEHMISTKNSAKEDNSTMLDLLSLSSEDTTTLPHHPLFPTLAQKFLNNLKKDAESIDASSLTYHEKTTYYTHLARTIKAIENLLSDQPFPGKKTI